MATLLSTLPSQLRRNGRTIVLTIALSALPFTLAVFLFLSLDVPPNQLTRDPTAVAGVAPYIGFISQLGLMLWAAAVAVALFVANAVRNDRGARPFRWLMLVGGLFTLLLALDDAFLFHEEALPALGLPEWAATGAYAALLIVFLVGFARSILETDFLLLLLALIAFATSVALDLGDLPGIFSVFEDGAKFVGTALWLVYFTTTGRTLLARSAPPPTA